MSPVLPFDIIPLIIEAVGENKDTNLLKALALVSYSFHQICSKHLFATVELHDADPKRNIASSKKGFIKLLESRPDVVKYIRKLTYEMEYHPSIVNINRFQSRTSSSFVNHDNLLSPILPNLLRTIPHLNCLTINASKSDWNTLDSSLTSAFLHLMHLPTMNHIGLSFIKNFPLSILSSSVNLHRLDILILKRSNPLEEDGSPEIVVQLPQIREFHTSESSQLMTKLLHAKRQDGQPAFNLMNLRRLSMSFTRSEDEQNIRYLLRNAKLLDDLHLSVGHYRNLVGLRDILSPIACTLKVLDLTVSLQYYERSVPLPLAGICEELEAMAGHYTMLEALSFHVHVDGNETADFIGSIIQKVEKVLVKPGWSALRQVSIKISIACCLVSREFGLKLSRRLQFLPDKYLSRLSKLEFVTFNYSTYAVKCPGRCYDRDYHLLLPFSPS
jgi:hypothetical protein